MCAAAAECGCRKRGQQRRDMNRQIDRHIDRQTDRRRKEERANAAFCLWLLSAADYVLFMTQLTAMLQTRAPNAQVTPVSAREEDVSYFWAPTELDLLEATPQQDGGIAMDAVGVFEAGPQQDGGSTLDACAWRFEASRQDDGNAMDAVGMLEAGPQQDGGNILDDDQHV